MGEVEIKHLVDESLSLAGQGTAVYQFIRHKLAPAIKEIMLQNEGLRGRIRIRDSELVRASEHFNLQRDKVVDVSLEIDAIVVNALYAADVSDVYDREHEPINIIVTSKQLRELGEKLRRATVGT